SSRGMPSKNCLKMNTAITAGTCGKITDQYVFSKLSALSSWKIGTMSTWLGIIMPRMISNSTVFDPLNRRRESANAAIDAKNTVSTAVTTDVTALAMYQFQMSPAWKYDAYDASVG